MVLATSVFELPSHQHGHFMHFVAVEVQLLGLGSEAKCTSTIATASVAFVNFVELSQSHRARRQTLPARQCRILTGGYGPLVCGYILQAIDTYNLPKNDESTHGHFLTPER